MPFVEVFAPKGSLRDEQRAQISNRMVQEVMRAEGAPDSGEARAISWLVWQDIEAWSVGGATVGAGEPPRYVVRVGVPAGSMSDSKRADIVRRVTRVLADADDDPQRLWAEPLAWVHVTEIPEGNWGAMGRVVRFEDIAAYVLTGTTDGAAQTTTADAATTADATPTDGAAQTTAADAATTADATLTVAAASTAADATTTAAAG